MTEWLLLISCGLHFAAFVGHVWAMRKPKAEPLVLNIGTTFPPRPESLARPSSLLRRRDTIVVTDENNTFTLVEEDGATREVRIKPGTYTLLSDGSV